MSRFIFVSGWLERTERDERPGHVRVCLGKLEAGEPIWHKASIDHDACMLGWDVYCDFLPDGLLADDDD